MMHEPKLASANYTTLLKDISRASRLSIQTLFSSFVFEYDSQTHSSIKLEDVFYGKWNYYEICDSDEEIFVSCLTDILNVNKAEWHELLVNYNKEYNYATGNKRTMARHDVSESDMEGSSDDTSDSVTKDYSLPNKQVSVDLDDGYATGASKEHSTLGNERETHRESTYDSTIVHTYDNEFLDLKRKYMNQIRNLFEEFADKFSDCFYHVFS